MDNTPNHKTIPDNQPALPDTPEGNSAPDSSILTSVKDLLENTGERFDMIESFIKNQIETKDKMINSLHSELQYYKDDKSEKFVEQLMKSIIKVRKDMSRLINSDKWTSIDTDALKEQYTYVFEDLTDLLQLQNIVPYSSRPGDLFDGKIHQPKSEPTDQPKLDRTIKESLSEGFKKGEKILIAERVTIYSYQGGAN